MTSSEVKNVPPAGGKPKGKPWYRQATPFLVFAGPAVVVVASLVSAYLAFSARTTWSRKTITRPVKRLTIASRKTHTLPRSNWTGRC